MKTLATVEKELVLLTEELSTLTNRQKLEFFLEFVDDFVELSAAKRVPVTKVQGCISDVYVYVHLDTQQRLVLEASSGALLIRGFVAFLCDLFSGLTVADFLAVEAAFFKFIEDADLATFMVPTRANALGNIYVKLKDEVGRLGEK